MSMTPYPQPTPLGYVPQMPPSRPTSVTVLAIIGFVLVALSLVSQAIGLAGAVAQLTGHASVSPANMTQAMLVYQLASNVLSILLALVLLTGCIGLLFLKSWARALVVFWAVVYILFDIVAAIVAMAWLFPSLAEQLVQNYPPGSAEAQGARVGVYIGGTCTMLLSLIYPIFALVYLRKSDVVAAFEGTGRAAWIGEMQPGYPPGYNPPPTQWPPQSPPSQNATWPPQTPPGQ